MGFNGYLLSGYVKITMEDEPVMEDLPMKICDFPAWCKPFTRGYMKNDPKYVATIGQNGVVMPVVVTPAHLEL